MSEKRQPRPFQPDPPPGELGPAMSSLPNDTWRRFVIAMCESGTVSYTRAMQMADPDRYNDNPNAAGVAGHRLAHDARIQAAIREEGQRRMGAAVSIAVGSLVLFVQNTTLPARDRMKAAAMILNRAGLPETTEHHVKTERVLSDQEKVESILRIAQAMGIDGKALLGKYGYTPAEVVALPAPEDEELFKL